MNTNEVSIEHHDRLLIDIGNTSCKVAFAQGKKIEKTVKSREGEHPLLFLEGLLTGVAFNMIVLASVQKYDPDLVAWLGARCGRLIVVDGDAPTALRIDYQTTDRLGADLLAGGLGAITRFPGEDLLVVDFGTAITVEWIDRDGRLLGLNISPGLHIRLKSLYQHTAGLPLIAFDSQEPIPDMGIDTKGAITAGVVWGILHEIEGYIHRHPGKKVIFTGGDAIFFAEQLKIPIFADCNLIFTGLAEIAETHA
ncbi:MAG: type III pantothenate kinase [Bacteroidales bacterium]|nr:type III pantothenate kinase [Bacteroidales bacterium]